MRIVIDLQSVQGLSKNRGMGRYSLSLAQAMARLGKEHDIWIALNGLFPDTIDEMESAFQGLVPPEQIVVWQAPGPVAAADPANAWRRETGELLLESFLASLRPDIVHVSSLFEGFGDDCITSIGRDPERVTAAAILYDLIPCVLPETRPNDRLYWAWYWRKLQSLKNAELWLAISNHTRQEAIQRLALPEDRVVNISAGYDLRFRPIAIAPETEANLRGRFGLTRTFVLHVGPYDPRKNIEATMRAFALLPDSLRQDYQLVFVCDIPDYEQRRLAELAHREGLRRDEVVFTGFVPDRDLIALYNLCTLFVFPSLYEGFGLPPLEAMACGAPVIASNASSLPEVVGWDKALFDPKSPQAIARKMHEALTSEPFREALREHGLDQAKRFSWEESARRALTAFEDFCSGQARTRPHAVALRPVKPTLACLSPLPPARSGIADYSRELLPELARYYRIELIVDQEEVSDPWLLANFPVRTVGWFDGHADRYDRILYQFGNSEFHKHMFGLLKRHAGVVVLHDFYLGAVLHWMGCTGYAPGVFRRELYLSHGYRALIDSGEKGEEVVALMYPCNRSVIEGAEGVIVCSQDVADLAERWYSRDTAKEWRMIPRTKEAEAPHLAAEQYSRAIERFAEDGRYAQRRRLVRAIAQIDNAGTPPDEDLVATAMAITENQRRMTNVGQLLIDISTIIHHDFETGIQRVTRAHLQHLVRKPPAGWRVEPVYAIPPSRYRYARAFTAEYLSLPSLGLSDDVVEVNAPAIFLGLDLTAHVVSECPHLFTELRARGVRLYFIVYDLLPVIYPEWWRPEMNVMFTGWLRTITQMADGIVCISRSVAHQLLEWIENAPPSRSRSLRIGYFHLGADAESAPPQAVKPSVPQALQVLALGTPIFLMVGTVEPRKGYAQTLAAFEKVWQRGDDICLVIVGNQGWMVEPLVERLREHPELGRSLFWLEGVSDDTLLELYRGSTALLMASRAEGFGLPLIEAARHRLPIIARDIPVFREVCGEHAFYFNGEDPEDLAEAIRKWLELHREGRAPSTEGMKWLTWEQSTQQLLDVILGNKWYRTWDPEHGVQGAELHDQ